LRVGGEVHVLVAGSGSSSVAGAAAKLSGVSEVLHADDALYANGLAEPLTDLIVRPSSSDDAIVGAATSVAKSVLPRVAALLNVAQVSAIVEVVSDDTFKRPIYADNAIQTVQTMDAKKVITVRTASFATAESNGSAAIETIASAGDKGLSKFVSEEIVASERPELTSARMMISGGRALEIQRGDPADGGQAGRCSGGKSCCGGCGLCAERLAGGADRLGGCARALHRGRHLGCDPAFGGHEGQQAGFGRRRRTA
jgi:electron transfer flavoprotein alpha subunit